MMTNKWKKIIYGFFLVSCISVSFVSTSITSQASSKTTVEITLQSGTTPTTESSETSDYSSTSSSSSETTTSSTRSSSSEMTQTNKIQQLLKTNDRFSWGLIGLGIVLLLFVFYLWRKKEV